MDIGSTNAPSSESSLGSGWLRPVAMLGFGVAAAAALFGFGTGDPASDGRDEEVVRLSVEPVVRLPMEMNERVERWIHRFTTDQKASFQHFLDREGLYSEIILDELRARGMPEELLYLALIESGFSARATSSASAAGVWQFMGPTAEQYGLRVDGWVDERRDPVEATGAALDYLEWLHDRYDSWYLAAAAYNAGPGRVDRVLRQHAGGRKGDEAIYWDIIEHLPFETRHYVPRLIAAVTLAQNADSYGFARNEIRPYEFDRIWVPGRTPLSKVASSLDVPLDLMKRLNPHLIRGVTPPGESYALRIPVGSSGAVLASLGRSDLRAADD